MHLTLTKLAKFKTNISREHKNQKKETKKELKIARRKNPDGPFQQFSSRGCG